MNLIKLITPNNLLAEESKFFETSNYHPTFHYDWENTQPQLSGESARLKLVRAILQQNHEDTVKFAKEYFEINNFSLLGLANKITKQMPSQVQQQDQEDFINAFESAFNFFGLNEYSIQIVNESGFNFRPSYKSQMIYMSKDANFQFFDTDGEVRHELTHIIRYENGKFNKIIKSKNYLPTEEGLATLMQDTSVNSHASTFQHAAEYIASTIGLNGSLRDIYNYLTSIGFNQKLSWQRASRHKFGFINTQEPGDILKPAMYFAHSQKLAKLNSDEKLRLFVGKISATELGSHSAYKGIVDADKIKEFFQIS